MPTTTTTTTHYLKHRIFCSSTEKNGRAQQPDFARFFPFAGLLLLVITRDFFSCCLLLTSLFWIHFSGYFFLVIFTAQERFTFPLKLLTSSQLGSASHTHKYYQHTQTDLTKLRSETRSTRFYLHFHSCWTRIAPLCTTPSNDIDYLNYSLALCTGIEGDNGLI